MELCQDLAKSLPSVPKPYFDFYLKEIEFRFNHRNEDIFKILANIIVKSVPKP